MSPSPARSVTVSAYFDAVGAVVAFARHAGLGDVSVGERMLAAAPHRGAHTAMHALGRCVVGVSRRTDSREAALAVGGDLVAGFAGCLDNAVPLAEALCLDKQSGVHEADVVLAAFRAWGPAAPSRLRGAFAAVVTDGHRLWCFRDHLGFGPLFYREDGGGCYVGSEAKQVVAGAGIPSEPDLDILQRVLFRNDDEDMPSALAGVHRLPKATVLTVTDGGYRTDRYWDPAPLLETSGMEPEEVQRRFDELMDQAVGRTLRGEGDVVSLSGGVDSPAVAAYAVPRHRELTDRPLGALSAVFPDFPSVDERRYVDLVAGELGLELHTYEQQAQPLDRLRDWGRLVDGPVPTISLSHYEEHYRTARSLGFRTVLSGELAELVFDMRNWLLPHLLTQGRVRAVAAHLGRQREAGSSPRTLVREILRAFVPTRMAAARLRTDTRGVPSWIDLGRANEAAIASLVPVRRRWRKMQLSAATMGSGITAEAEAICQEVCGVQARRPWADIDLWEFFLTLPAEVKFPDNGRKSLVRRLLRGRVPDVILDREDKTLFDAAIMHRVDYPELRRWLAQPQHRMLGVDYPALQWRLDREDLSLMEFMWAKDLAAIHAFLALW